jgi:hypothetical protein
MTFYVLDRIIKSDDHDFRELPGGGEDETQKRLKVHPDFWWYVEDEKTRDDLKPLLGKLPLSRQLESLPALRPEDEALIVYREPRRASARPRVPMRPLQRSANWKFGVLERKRR